jgi:hypothetical protein
MPESKCPGGRAQSVAMRDMRQAFDIHFLPYGSAAFCTYQPRA